MKLPKKPKRRKKRKARRYAPRPDMQVFQSVSAKWIDNGRTTGRNTVVFRISEDIIKVLWSFHYETFKGIYVRRTEEALRNARIIFLRLTDSAIPALLMTIETPNFNPVGNRLRSSKGRRQYFVYANAPRLGLKSAMPTTPLEFMYQQDNPVLLGGGILIIFPDEYMLAEGPKNREHFQPEPVYKERNPTNAVSQVRERHAHRAG